MIKLRPFLLALALFLFPAAASAQCNGVFPASTLCGTVAGGIPGAVATSTILPPIAGFISCPASNWVSTINTTSICTQPTFPDISGTLAINKGGTGQTSASAAYNALAPTPTRAGDIVYWNGSTWTTLAGNNSGTQVLSESSSGVPSWAAIVGTVTSVTCGTGLTGGTFTSSGTCALALNSAVLQASPTAPSSTTSTTPGVMLGMGVTTCRFTPTYSTRVRFAFNGSINNTTSGQTTSINLRYGTGAGPTNGTPATGTQPATTIAVAIGSTNYILTGNLEAIVTGLTVGTTYWFDIAMFVSGGTGAYLTPSCNASEIL
jgi:hypothetical protein